MTKILVVCGNGLGSSLILEMNVKRALGELGLVAEVSHTDLGSSKTEAADLYMGAEDIVAQLDDGTRHVIPVVNLLDLAAIKNALVQHLQA